MKKNLKKAFYHSCFCSHAIPQRFNPLSAKDSKDHHERVEKIGEIPPKKG